MSQLYQGSQNMDGHNVGVLSELATDSPRSELGEHADHERLAYLHRPPRLPTGSLDVSPANRLITGFTHANASSPLDSQVHSEAPVR